MQEYKNPDNWKTVRQKKCLAYMCRPLPGIEIKNRFTGKRETVVQGKFVISLCKGDYIQTSCDGWHPGADITAISFKQGFMLDRDVRNALMPDGEMDWVLVHWDFPKDVAAFYFDIKEYKDHYIPEMKITINSNAERNDIGDYVVCDKSGDQILWHTAKKVKAWRFRQMYDMRAFAGNGAAEPVEKPARMIKWGGFSNKEKLIELGRKAGYISDDGRVCDEANQSLFGVKNIG